MRLDGLFNLLLEQVENLKELLFAVKLQQECLVNNTREKLDESTKAAEILFSRINQLQITIIAEIKNINIEETVGLKEFRLSELVDKYAKIDEEAAKKLALIRKRIVMYMGEISKINFQNSYLIDHSMQLIKSVLTTAAKSKNAIFDRRV